MSVLIKGFEMPDRCGRCFMYDAEYEECVVFGYTLPLSEVLKEYRPRNCPLVEIPPHGDLIDQNALKLSILNLCFRDEVSILKNILGAVNNAPVIIEAEEET